MSNNKSALDPIYNLFSIVLLICAVILTIIKPDYVGSWIDAPAWFGGFVVLYFVTSAFTLRTYGKVSRVLEDIEKREVRTYEDD